MSRGRMLLWFWYPMRSEVTAFIVIGLFIIAVPVAIEFGTPTDTAIARFFWGNFNLLTVLTLILVGITAFYLQRQIKALSDQAKVAAEQLEILRDERRPTLFFRDQGAAEEREYFLYNLGPHAAFVEDVFVTEKHPDDGWNEEEISKPLTEPFLLRPGGQKRLHDDADMDKTFYLVAKYRYGGTGAIEHLLIAVIEKEFVTADRWVSTVRGHRNHSFEPRAYAFERMVQMRREVSPRNKKNHPG